MQSRLGFFGVTFLFLLLFLALRRTWNLYFCFNYLCLMWLLFLFVFRWNLLSVNFLSIFLSFYFFLNLLLLLLLYYELSLRLLFMHLLDLVMSFILNWLLSIMVFLMWNMKSLRLKLSIQPFLNLIYASHLVAVNKPK